jgi:cold shock protein
MHRQGSRANCSGFSAFAARLQVQTLAPPSLRARRVFYDRCLLPFAGLISSGSDGEANVAKGTVKWFNSNKGYGFIQQTGGGNDVFVHISAVERAGLNSSNEGQVVEFEIVEIRGKSSAENLKISR